MALIFSDKGDGVAKNKESRRLEWARLPDCRGENYWKVEEDAKNSEGCDDSRDTLTDTPYVSSERISEEKK